MQKPDNNIRKRKIFFLASLFLAIYLPAQELRVYQSSTVPVKDREKALKGDASLSGVQVTVFGQFREFDSANKANAKYVIMPSSWITYNSNYKPVYQFSKDGQTNTKLMILTTKPEWTMANIAKGKVGIVDELGRKDTKTYVQEIAGKFKLIKRVTKPEDRLLKTTRVQGTKSSKLFLCNSQQSVTTQNNNNIQKKQHQNNTF